MQEHRTELIGVEPLHERYREADARSQEPVAERERALVYNDVDLSIKLEARRGGGDRAGHRDLPRDQPADEHRGGDELPEERQKAERDATYREDQHQSGDHVGGVFRAARDELLDARNEGQE